uniref:Uncharacterized protein n=1 Tax=Panagrolaimus sp. ES5 TaxID=591445 RepID=A0AC34F1M7_9BILA
MFPNADDGVIALALWYYHFGIAKMGFYVGGAMDVATCINARKVYDWKTAAFSDFFRVGECKQMEGNIKRMQLSFARNGLLGSFDLTNDKNLWCNRNVKQPFRNALYKICCTLAFSYKFTMNGKTLSSDLNEAMELKSETELIPPKGYIGVYHNASRYSDGSINLIEAENRDRSGRILKCLTEVVDVLHRPLAERNNLNAFFTSGRGIKPIFGKTLLSVVYNTIIK